MGKLWSTVLAVLVVLRDVRLSLVNILCEASELFPRVSLYMLGRALFKCCTVVQSCKVSDFLSGVSSPPMVYR